MFKTEALKEKDPLTDSFATIHEWEEAMKAKDSGIEFGETHTLQSIDGKEMAIVGSNEGRHYLLSRADYDVRLEDTFKSGIEALIKAKQILGLN